MSTHSSRSRLGGGAALALLAGALSVGHAASLGGISSGTLGAWSQSAQAIAVCATGSPYEPCVVPTGYVLDDNLAWFADVFVFGEVTGNVDVTGGSVTLARNGTVDGDIKQSGSGDVTLATATSVGGTIEEFGDGSVNVGVSATIGGSAIEQDSGDLTIGDLAVITQDADASPDGLCTISPLAFVGGQLLGDCAP